MSDCKSTFPFQMFKLPENFDELPEGELQDVAQKYFLMLTEDSGVGLGICRVANMLFWNDQKPNEKNPDWNSIVAVRGPLEKYTREELVKMLRVAKLVTDVYDSRSRWRQGANIWIIDKDMEWSEGHISWLCKRLSWECGRMYYASLDEVAWVIHMHHIWCERFCDLKDHEYELRVGQVDDIVGSDGKYSGKIGKLELKFERTDNRWIVRGFVPFVLAHKIFEREEGYNIRINGIGTREARLDERGKIFVGLSPDGDERCPQPWVERDGEKFIVTYHITEIQALVKFGMEIRKYYGMLEDWRT